MVCNACGAKTQDEGEALLEAILQARGYMNADGMVTAKAKAMFDRIYDDEGNVKPHGLCDA